MGLPSGHRGSSLRFRRRLTALDCFAWYFLLETFSLGPAGRVRKRAFKKGLARDVSDFTRIRSITVGRALVRGGRDDG